MTALADERWRRDAAAMSPDDFFHALDRAEPVPEGCSRRCSPDGHVVLYELRLRDCDIGSERRQHDEELGYIVIYRTEMWTQGEEPRGVHCTIVKDREGQVTDADFDVIGIPEHEQEFERHDNEIDRLRRKIKEETTSEAEKLALRLKVLFHTEEMAHFYDLDYPFDMSEALEAAQGKKMLHSPAERPVA